MGENWLEKYKPRKVSEIIGNRNQIKQFENYIEIFPTNPSEVIDEDYRSLISPNIIISGPDGIGKNLIIDLILAKYGFRKVVPDTSGIYVMNKKKETKKNRDANSKLVSDISYYNNIVSRKIFTPDGKMKKHPSAIVFDNISSVSNKGEKETIRSLIEINIVEKKIPIIIVSNTKHTKLLVSLRKKISTNVEIKKKKRILGKKQPNEIVFNYATTAELIKFMRHVCHKENMIIGSKRGAEELEEDIVIFSQHTVRNLLGILYDLQKLFGNKITRSHFEKYTSSLSLRNTDVGLFSGARIILTKFSGIDQILNIYSTERTSIPLLVHENYLTNIQVQYPSMSLKKQLDVFSKIIGAISKSDVINGLIYSSQYWSLQDIYGFHSCVLPSYYANELPGKINTMTTIRYTRAFSKSSIKQINKKTIKESVEKVDFNQILEQISVYDWLHIANILIKLYSQGRKKEAHQIIKPYSKNLSEKNTEELIKKIMKIDKISGKH